MTLLQLIICWRMDAILSCVMTLCWPAARCLASKHSAASPWTFGQNALRKYMISCAQTNSVKLITLTPSCVTIFEAFWETKLVTLLKSSNCTATKCVTSILAAFASHNALGISASNATVVIFHCKSSTWDFGIFDLENLWKLNINFIYSIKKIKDGNNNCEQIAFSHVLSFL